MIKTLNKSQIRDLLDKHIAVDRKDVIKLDDGFVPHILLVNGVPAFFEHNASWLPTLKYLQSKALLKKVTVDMGAIPFLIKGADIMRPGIKHIEDGIVKDELVVLIDEKYAKGIALGKALLNSQDMQQLQKGKVITNVHFVGDHIWNYV